MTLRALGSAAGLAAAVLVPFSALTACSTTDTTATDRQANIIGIAISYPRQSDANGLARAALTDWKGTPNTLSILEATDLHPASANEPAARLVIRIGVPPHTSTGFGDAARAAYDVCYQLQYEMPSSSQIGNAVRIDCTAGAPAITPPPAPPVPHLPPDATERLTRILQTLPPHPTPAAVTRALREAFPSDTVTLDSEILGNQLAVAAGVPHPNGADCALMLRTGRRIQTIHPAPTTLMPGESGCVADLAIHPVMTH